MRADRILMAGLALAGAGACFAAVPQGYQANVSVGAPTRIDWTFAVSNRSLANPPADWLGGYESRRQSYELYVPPRRDPRKALPVIVFVSPGNEPAGWKRFENVCRQNGILFAGPRGAGNDCPPKKRLRLVLDVLDDVRRNYPTDPDRTYLAGFSGGGRIACAVAFALPEYFGGILSLCAGGELRGESWLRQRVADRLAVALVTGEKDFNRAEVERLHGPLLSGVGVTARVWVQPGMGHDIPPEKTLTEAVRWLDASASRRQEEARRHPASRVGGSAAPGREEQSQALFAEAKKRLEKRETLYSGLMQLQGCMARWPDLKAGADARALLLEYDGRTERPWETDDVAEQRRFLIARARALDAYASGDLPPQYARERPGAAREAVRLWQKVLADAPDTAAGREAKKRVPELEKIAAPEK